MELYVVSIQERIEKRELHRCVWCSTGSMLADATTEFMRDQLIRWFYTTGCWEPEEYEISELPETASSLWTGCCPSHHHCIFCDDAAALWGALVSRQDPEPPTLSALLSWLDSGERVYLSEYLENVDVTAASDQNAEDQAVGYGERSYVWNW